MTPDRGRQTGITLEADRLETRLQIAVRDRHYDGWSLAVLYAAALEVAELDHWLAAGHGDRLLWVRLV